MRLSDTASSGWLWKALSCGGCAVVGLWLLGWVLAALLGPMRDAALSVRCQANLMRLTRACRMYADDYDDRLPQASRWMDRVLSYTDGERQLHCPAASRPGEPRYGYALSGAVAGMARSDIADPAVTALVYDSTDLVHSAVGSPAAVPRPGRHVARRSRAKPPVRGNYVGYVGGSVVFEQDTVSRGR